MKEAQEMKCWQFLASKQNVGASIGGWVPCFRVKFGFSFFVSQREEHSLNMNLVRGWAKKKSICLDFSGAVGQSFPKPAYRTT